MTIESPVLETLVGRLLAQAPGSAEAEEARHAIESLLMAALQTGGRSAGEDLVGSLAGHGHRLERMDALPCFWRVVLPRPRVLELWFTGGDEPAVAAVSYRAGRPWGTRAQKRAAAQQAAFYARYERLDRLAAASSPHDRLIALVGELEADVANGGFGQYLGNKGQARAAEALASLSAVGARRTARWLASAIRMRSDGAALERLDRQFGDASEDLASLVMAYIEKHPED